MRRDTVIQMLAGAHAGLPGLGGVRRDGGGVERQRNRLVYADAAEEGDPPEVGWASRWARSAACS